MSKISLISANAALSAVHLQSDASRWKNNVSAMKVNYQYNPWHSLLKREVQ
jgi:hypothetical protein